jgi:hypothetical protein
MKRGDRVKVVEYNYSGEPDMTGRIGFVTHVEEGSICVRFAGWSEGHNGESKNRSLTNRWYFDPTALKVIRKAKSRKKKATR